jgi:hypothetical protein
MRRKRSLVINEIVTPSSSTIPAVSTPSIPPFVFRLFRGFLGYLYFENSMTQQAEKWIHELRKFIANCREQLPLRARGDFRSDEEWKCRVIGGNFISWLREHGPSLLQERAVLADYKRWDKEPIVIFTSEEPGLVAAKEILGGDSSRVLFLYPKEYKRWIEMSPDEEFHWHVHTWSYFSDLSEDALDRAGKIHPIDADEQYWLQEEGTTCGENFGRGGSHLWKWDGVKPVLLEEAFNHWVS